MTKNGTDPMISRDENVSDIIEPPTEEEMNMAITGNMKRLLTVVSTKPFIMLILPSLVLHFAVYSMVANLSAR